MIRTALRLMVALVAGLVCFVPLASQEKIRLPSKIGAIFEKKCSGCHSGDSAEGNFRVDNFNDVKSANQLDRLNRAQDQIFFNLMPPESAEALSSQENQLLADWLRSELRQRKASRLDEKLRQPGFGNYIEHDLLFRGDVSKSGESGVSAKGFTPARRWLVSPQIFHQRVNDLFGLTGRDRQSKFYGVTNPFVLPDHSGVRDSDVYLLDGGHLLVMLGNAKWISEKQVFAAIAQVQDRRKMVFANPKDRWYPSNAPPEFVAIVRGENPPSDEEMIAAIQRQFRGVLRREPREAETAKYLQLFQNAVKVGGKIKGLQTVLSSVLLESEFLYRMEFGEGPVDEAGRKLLSPMEAAFAIAYALGDRGPDEELRRAAREGQLRSRADFQREVRRLLDDAKAFAGPVDPGLSGKNMRSHASTHPKLVRFFREFFGYPNATKIFKDLKRSNGFYQNPSRGTAGTPGFLVKEADRIVDWVLARDQNVIEGLLTTDQYFVYHDRDNLTGKKILAEWREAYEHFRGTDWKNQPEKVTAENEDFIRSRPSLRILGGKQKREFLRYMYYWEESFGRGRKPFTTPSFAHGYTYNHSTFYNLPPTPHIFRYNQVLQKNFKGLDDEIFWDYQVEQPFRIEHRKGLLTHPAWLIAHSGNFHTDPIRRGRWIREKLLAGRVPDIPITVDAQVPEDPHRTFRERVESVTTKAECWKCHRQMNPLGLAFEAYDDFGRYRLDEPLEHAENLISKTKKKDGFDLYRTKRVRTDGELKGSGDEGLDGPVDDASDLIDRLARSPRVRQSVIRHVFRFFMGRNEHLSDSSTLREADRAYVESGGSFRALVISLLSSDSFRYRKGTPGESPVASGIE
ncbi:MAG: DUF1588 domain-containing protein [Planctomycetota bacterium]|nr:DUF1588 domain-containing protein [Planctomycetota bacterium]